MTTRIFGGNWLMWSMLIWSSVKISSGNLKTCLANNKISGGILFGRPIRDEPRR